MKIDAIIIPGCSFKKDYDPACTIGHRVQNLRARAALNLHWQTGARLAFSGTAEEADRNREFVADYADLQGKPEPVVIYDDASRNTRDHGIKLRALVADISGALAVVSCKAHMPRVVLSLQAGFGNEQPIVTCPIEAENDSQREWLALIAKHEPAAVAANIADGMFSDTDYLWAVGLTPYVPHSRTRPRVTLTPAAAQTLAYGK